MRVQIIKDLGRFDFASQEKEWQLAVRVWGPDKGISALFPEDREPEVDHLPPSEVVELIAERVAWYLYRSNAAQEQAALAWMREHAEALDHAWAVGLARELTAKGLAAMERAAELLKAYPAVAPSEDAPVA